MRTTWYSIFLFGAFMLAACGESEATPTATAAPEQAVGTHLLCGVTAAALRDAFEATDHPEAGDLGAAFRVIRRDGTHYVVRTGEALVRLDGEPVVQEAPAALGASIECAGREFRIVRVHDG